MLWTGNYISIFLSLNKNIKYVINVFIFYYFSDDSLGYEFPFVLKSVNREGTHCAWCPWYRFCRGCTILCCETDFNFAANHIAIDWDPTALHLRYQTSQESVRLTNKYIFS